MYSVIFKISMLLLTVSGITLVKAAFGFGDSDRVLLKNIQTLTLRSGEKTNYRRSYAVPQLNCVGGSAGCKYEPDVVQCYNRGSDGRDVQWECKADLDSDVRFGKVEVVCEGYEYPDDPYILQGSCGLEYTLDHTKQGWKNKNGGYFSSDSSYNYKKGKGKSWFQVGDIVMLCICAAIGYAIYTTCVNTNHQGDTQPPPYGFRPEYTQDSGDYNNSQQSSYRDQTSYTGNRNRNNGFGGFWTGAGLGGMMGYLFGNRGGYRNNYGYGNNYGGYGMGSGMGTGWGTGWGNGWGSGWGGGRQGYTTPTSHYRTSSSSSGSTRSSSGFGGTRRR